MSSHVHGRELVLAHVLSQLLGDFSQHSTGQVLGCRLHRGESTEMGGRGMEGYIVTVMETPIKEPPKRTTSKYWRRWQLLFIWIGELHSHSDGTSDKGPSKKRTTSS